jgi:tRNA(adenine34) deaminase
MAVMPDMKWKDERKLGKDLQTEHIKKQIDAEQTMAAEKIMLQQEIELLTNRFDELGKSERHRLARLKRKLDAIAEQEQIKEKQYAIDCHYMKEAIRQARKAAAIGEVPIGCIIVKDNKIIARGYNRRNTDHSTLSHAEVTAIRKASKKLNDWRLEDCTLYVTLEPCQMCAGAIVQARVPRVVMGSMNPKAGCGGSVLNILQMKEFNHKVEVTRGVMEEECSEVLSAFFKRLRAH